MRVLVVSPCMGGYGGLEAFNLALASGLSGDTDVSVSVLFKETTQFKLGDDLKEKLKAAVVPVEFCKKASLQLLRAIKAADVVHLQNPCPDVTLLAKLLGKPLLTQVINHKVEGNGIHQKLWQMCLSLADRRFYISDFVRSSWEDNGTLPDSHVVFPTCKLAEGFCPFAERRGFSFVGRWIANKGIETLVKAYHKAGLKPHEWPLRLMGDGPLRDSILKYISQQGLQGVEVFGFVDEDTKAAVIRSSCFMVIPPNTKEDFGLTAIEARNMGVPCIITRDGGLPEAAGRFVISCEPGSVEDLARALRTAAGMSAAEYAEMASQTYNSLKTELPHPGFYRQHYLELSKGQVG